MYSHLWPLTGARGICLATMIFGWFLAKPAAAQTITARAEVSPQVSEVGKPVTYTISMSGSRSIPTPPVSFPHGLTPLGPPSREFSFYVDNRGQQITTSFRFQLLPAAPGEYDIGPFSIPIGTNTVQIPAVHLKVVGGRAAASTNRQSAAPPSFLRVQISPTEPFVDQWCEMELQLYYRDINIADQVEILNLPQTGALVTPFHELQPERRAVGDLVYEVRRFRAHIRFLTPGEYELAPALRISLILPKRRRHDDFWGPSLFPEFDELLFGGVETHPYVVQATPVRIKCAQLPQPDQSVQFSGLVGNFSLSARVSPTNITAGDPITLTVAISGTGTVDKASMPPYDPGPPFKVYEPKLTSKNISQDGRTGTKIFELVLIPTNAGIFELPPVELTYFDSTSGAYVTARAPAPTIHVAATHQPSTPTGATTSVGPQPESSDIVFLKPLPYYFWKLGSLTVAQAAYRLLVINLLPVIALALAWATSLYVRQLRTKTKLSQRRRAYLVARQHLAAASAHLKSGDTSPFYAELWKAIHEFFSLMLDIPRGQVTPDFIRQQLNRNRNSASLATELEPVLTRIETVQYAPPTELSQVSTATMKQDLKITRTVLAQSVRMVL